MTRDLRACVVTQRPYPSDARLGNQLQGLQEAGYTVDLIITRSKNKPNFSVESGINIYRIPSVERKRASKLRYLVEYLSFLISAFFMVTQLHLRHRYQLVFVTNLPDGLIYSALIPKLMGAKIMFDLRETTPEMFMDRFGGDELTIPVRIMGFIEQACLRFADGVLACTEQQKQAVVKRGADPNKVSVMLNVATVELQFEAILPDPKADTSEAFRIITHGTIIRRYGIDVLIRAMPIVLKEVPQAILEIVGKGEARPELELLVKALKLEKSVTFPGFITHEELIAKLRAAHLAVVPLNRNPESNLIHTHKMFEYITLGMPVIATRTDATEAYFSKECLSYVDSGNHEQMAKAIIELAKNPKKRLSLATHALEQMKEYSPANQRMAVRRAAERLVPPPVRHETAAPAPAVKEEMKQP
jgi:glycosyltransferase involved in cell wall biosynthesis